MLLRRYPIWLLLWAIANWTSCLADQIVYLTRPASQPVGLSEPVFSPNTLVANVGEKVHFIAHFEDQHAYRPGVFHMSLPGNADLFRVGRRSTGLLRNLLTMHLACTTEVSIMWFLPCS